MKAWDDRGYKTWNERQQDSRDLAKALKDFNDGGGKTLDPDPLDVQYDEDVKQAWANHVGYESMKEARREDAKMFLAIGFAIGFGFGTVLGIWLATR